MKRAIALGFFDGVHLGHAELLKRTKEKAIEYGLSPAVLSFDIHPDVLVLGQDVPLITDCNGRKEVIKRCFDIDDVIFIHFNLHVMRMPWIEFAQNIVEELEAAYVVVGHDFTFGNKGEGNANKLKAYCEEIGIGCDIIPEVKLDGRTVSSTYIRKLIVDGDVEQAAKFLGHPHCVSDTVHSGFHIGEKLNAPTINLNFQENVVEPRHGVYATKVVLSDGSEFEAVTNIGKRPTVGKDNKVNIESHLLDYSGNLYGTAARVDFYKFIRDEIKFDSYEELSKQIEKDIEITRKYFNK